MAEWTIVICFVLFGLLLVIVEVIFIPGTTVVGIAGFISMIVGIILSFKYFGGETGWLTLGGATAASGVLLYVALRTNVWRRFAINSSIDSKVNEVEALKFAVGMEGVALSALRPIGKGEFGGNVGEVRTMGEYVEAGSRIRIVRVSTNQIIVEIIN
ncbi:MAG TPA: NfeD family protein [Cyclobacteriaceae bacterium]|nr:NfeD family protein [Cyclobacteriaceae bacterium]